MAAIVVITAAATFELTTPERITARIAGLTDEAEALDLIREASRIIVNECQRPYGFGLATLEERIPGDGSPLMYLGEGPVCGTPLITYIDSVPIEDFEVIDRAEGVLYRERGWRWTVGSFASPLFLRTPGESQFDFTVRFQAGFTLPGDEPRPIADSDPVEYAPDLPFEIERACTELVRALHESAPTGVASERIGDYAVTYRDSDKANVLPPRVAQLLTPYRRVF